MILAPLAVVAALLAGPAPVVSAPIVAAPAVAPPAVSAQPPPGPVVVAVVPGLDWVDGPDPAARDALGEAAFAAMPVVTARGGACPADFWLTLSAGARAGLPGDDCEPPLPVSSGVSGWGETQRANTGRRHGAVVGSLAETVGARDGCVGANDPLSALGAARRDGTVVELQVLTPRCEVQLANLSGAPTLRDAVATLRRLEPSLLVLVGLPPPGEHLGAVAVVGEGYSGLLGGSPRRAGLVTVPDLTALVSSAGDGVRPTVAERVPYDTAVDRLVDLDRREHHRRRYGGFFFAGVITLQLLLYIWLAVRRRGGLRTRAVALAFAALPASGFVASLLPWWRSGVPWLNAVVCCLAMSALLALAGTAVWRRSPPVGVAAVVTGVFAVDLLTGGYLQEAGLGSYTAIAGGRFYGLGNVGFAVFASSAVVLLGALARRYGARAWLGGFVPLVALDALPRWGADFGGAVAVTAAIGAAVATRARRTVVAAGALLGLLLALGAAAVDYRRPAQDRTHLGRFADDVLHGGWTDTIARKASAAVHSVTGTWFPLLVVGSVLVAVLMLRRLRAEGDRSLDTTARALVALWVVGSLVNDSGVVVAAFGCAVAVPLLLAYVLERSEQPW